MSHARSWGEAFHHSPEEQTITAARKLATAVREYFKAGTSRNIENMADTLRVFDRTVERLEEEHRRGSHT